MTIVPRAPTPTIEPQEVFRPQATPVDTYIRPPEPAPSDLHNLAKGLENFSRDIRGMFQAREAADKEAAMLRGEAQFFKDNQVGYAEAVRQGKIPAFASKPFMEAYKEAEGKVIGARLASQMQLEYQTWEGRNTQDPANFDNFMADFLKRNLTQDDPYVLKGAMPYIYSTVNAGYTQRTQDAADATYNGSLDAHIAVSSMAIDSASDEGLSSGQGTDYDALWEELVAQRDTTLTSGIRGLDYDKKFIDVIAAKAIEERDPALLALLDRQLPGQSAPISATPYGREVKAKTIDALETVNIQAESAAYTAQQRRDAAMKDQLTAFAIETIMADPNAVLPENFWAEFEKVEPEARVKVQDWRNAALNGDQEDQEAIADLTYRILVRGENAMAVINEGTKGGAIRTTETLTRLYNLGQEDPVWQKTQTYQLGLKAIQQAAAQGGDLASFDPEFVSPAATAAALDFELSMRAWAQTDAGKAAIETNDVAAMSTEVARIQKVITDGFVITAADPAAYVQPTEISQDLQEAGFAPNPQAPTQAAVDEAVAADAALAASPAGQMPEWTTGTAPQLTTLPPAEQDLIREEADKRGIDPQIFLEETHRQVDELIRGVEQQHSPEPGEQSSNALAPWQSWISGSEGTDANYNETFGYGRFSGGDVNLTEMTLAEVMDLQDQMLSNPANSFNSSAVGRYQIVKKTLGGLVERMGLDPDTERFTPELQDRMFGELIESRGFSDWQAGNLTNKDFLANLSQEWVSLTGQSLPMAREEVLQVAQSVQNGPNGDIVIAGIGNGDLTDEYGIGAAIDAALQGENHLQVAKRYLNMDERNPEDSKTLAAFFKAASGNSLDPSTTAWCAAFVNAVLGTKGLGGTNSNLARSFLNYGEDVMGTPRKGDIIVFPRGNSSWQGHVGFVEGVYEKGGETWVKVLGGNQSTQESGSRGVTVNVKDYRLSDALGVRRPIAQPTLLAAK